MSFANGCLIRSSDFGTFSSAKPIRNYKLGVTNSDFGTSGAIKNSLPCGLRFGFILLLACG